MRMENVKNREKINDIIKVLLFIAVTFSISWSIWFSASNAVIEIIGSCMPSIVGFFILRSDKSGYYKDFGHRMIDFKLIRFPWILFILLVIPLITIMSIMTQKLLGGNTPSLNSFMQNVRNPLRILAFAILGIGAGFGEELGWRGFFLDTLLKYQNGLIAGLITGFVWATWHIPFALMNKESLFSINFINYFIFVILISVLIAAIYIRNNRSILSCILLHGMVNFSQYITFFYNPVSEEINVIRTIYLLFIVIGIILVSKTK